MRAKRKPTALCRCHVSGLGAETDRSLVAYGFSSGAKAPLHRPAIVGAKAPTPNPTARFGIFSFATELWGALFEKSACAFAHVRGRAAEPEERLALRAPGLQRKGISRPRSIACPRSRPEPAERWRRFSGPGPSAAGSNSAGSVDVIDQSRCAGPPRPKSSRRKGTKFGVRRPGAAEPRQAPRARHSRGTAVPSFTSGCSQNSARLRGYSEAQGTG